MKSTAVKMLHSQPFDSTGSEIISLCEKTSIDINLLCFYVEIQAHVKTWAMIDPTHLLLRDSVTLQGSTKGCIKVRISIFSSIFQHFFL